MSDSECGLIDDIVNFHFITGPPGVLECIDGIEKSRSSREKKENPSILKAQITFQIMSYID